MKKLVIIMSLFFLVCNAKRDNIYDPKNSDKAVIKGVIYEPDSLPVKDAFIELIHNDTVVKLDTSNISGEYGFEQIDPGIYKIIARTKYYDDVIIEAETLWAGTELNQYDMFFTTFHFEDDEIDDAPYGFSSIDGIWKVITDSTLNYSSNRVYNGTALDSGETAMTFFRSQTHMMDFNLKIKVCSTSGENWETGILFGYQDQRNYFVIKISKSLVKYCGIEDSIETMFYSRQINFSADVWLIRTDLNGDTIWTKTFGGAELDCGNSIKVTDDNGYIIAGYTYSFGRSGDVYLVKTDSNGDTLWTKTYGTGACDIGNMVRQTTDNGYIVVGGNGNVYIIKIDNLGNLVWEKTYGSTHTDYGYGVEQLSGSGYLIIGYIMTDNIDVYYLKIDAGGNKIKEQFYGDWQYNYGYSLALTPDEDCIIAGYTKTNIFKSNVYIIRVAQ